MEILPGAELGGKETPLSTLAALACYGALGQYQLVNHRETYTVSVGTKGLYDVMSISDSDHGCF